jgi:hypothetical protein
MGFRVLSWILSSGFGVKDLACRVCNLELWAYRFGLGF